MIRILVLCLGTLAAACLPAGAVTLGEALNATNLTWTTGGAAAWFGQATNTHDGYAAAQSGTVTDTQETWIETTVTGPSTLSFWWKVSSEFGWDFLQFKVGTNINSSVSGEEDWQQRTVYLGAGTQTLQWVYLKDDIYWSGEDAAWLDEVSWVPGGTLPAITTPPAATTVAAGLKCTLSAAVIGTPPLTYEWRFNGVSLADGGHISGATTPALVLTGVQTNDAGGYSLVVTNSYGSVTSSVASLTVLPAPDWLLALVNALDATNLVWSPGGDANWFSQTNTTHDGVAAARSGLITNSQSSTLETTVTGPGRLSYWCKVSSDFGQDFLQFMLGTNLTSSLSGEVAWEQHTVYLGPGTQTLQWEYLKYGIYSIGQGAAWLDEVSWVPGGTIPAITTQPVGANLSAGLSYNLNVVAEGTPLLNYQWQLNGTNFAGATDPMLRFASLQAGSAGDYRVVITNNYGAVTSLVARVTVLPSAPVITSQPRSQGVALGQDVALVVAARGTEPLTYQWLKNGIDVQGASGTVLSLPDFQASAVGVYQVVVSNTVGTVTSVAVALGVVPVIGWGSNSDGQTNVPISATNVMAVAAGYYHNLAIRADGTVIGWGSTNGGQTDVPATATSVVAVAGSYYGSFALRADGTVLAWGYNFYGQATVPANATNVVALAAGYAHTLALRADGTVGAWGYNSYGQATVPANATNVAAVAAGYNHSLGLCADGSVLAWGANTYNQTSVPASATNVMAVAAGYRHSLAVRADGTVIAWGDNSYGQASVPASATNIVAVSAGYRHSLALRADGAIVVWGSSSSGQTSVPDCATNVLAISAGYNHSLALLASSFSPSVMLPMAQRTAYVGETVSLVAAANGGLPLRYQWRCNGTNLLDGGRIRGASTPGLLLTGVQANDAASYSVVVTNTYGSVTSSVAVLSVEVPPPFTYTTYNGTVTITGYTGPGGGVTIPDTIHGLPVTSIGNYACFNSTNLTSITIPNSVTSIGDSAFYYCPSLTSVTIGNGVTNIGKTAFAVCGLTNIALPGSVISIGADAFYACYGLTSVAIPASVNHIGDAPFRACGGLVAITVDPANAFFSSVDGVLFTKNLTTLIKCPPGAKAGTYTLPSSVTSIGVDAFQGCYKLTNVGLPVGVTNIASAAFGGCSGLTSITIPAGVSSIGGNAFAWCTSMQAVYFQGNAPSLGLTVFNGANQATVYYLPGTTGWGTTFGDRPTAPWYAQPSITTQPSNQALWAEGNVTFEVGAMGEAPLSYQWQFNGTNVTDGGRVSGVHTPALVLSAVQTNDAGSYSVIVANNYGSVTSAVASLTVWVVPVVTAQPQGLTNNAGTVASFSVVATGVAPLNYQWWKDGVALRDGGNIAGATMAVMTLTNVLGGDAGGYNVLVSSAQGSVTSAVAVLTVRDPAISSNPASRTRIIGGSVSFTVGAVGTAPLSYQWRKSGGVLAGATAPSLVLTNLQGTDAGDYDVVVSNRFGSVTSEAARLDCIPPPAPQAEVVGWGSNFFGQTNVPSGLTNVVAITTGYSHALALTAEGRVVGWGDNWYRQAVAPAGLSNVVAVAAGDSHSLALTSDGQVVAWGDASSGQTTVPADLSNVVAVAAVGALSLALTADGRVAAWGDTSNGRTAVPTGLSNVVAVAAGSLALTADGRVVGWGPNYLGSATVPVGLSNVVAVAAGGPRLALTAGGRVVGWNHAQYPVPGDLVNVVAVAAGNHSLALTADGRVVGWGGTGYNYDAVTVPAGLSNVVAVSAGNNCSLALRGYPPGMAAPKIVGPRLWVATVDRDFHHRIMARNGVVGFGATGLPAGLLLNTTTGLITGRPLEAGKFTFTVYATNALGEGTLPVTLFVNKPLPAIPSQVAALGLGQPCHYEPVVDNEPFWFGQAGLPPGLALDAQTGIISGVPLMEGDFLVSLVASNKYGLGSGTITFRVRSVLGWGNSNYGLTDVSADLTNIVAVAAGGAHNLALTAQGQVAAWGGDNWYGQTNVPIGLRNVVAVAAGDTSSLALTADGQVAAWGGNWYGQITVPTGLSNVVAVAAGGKHSLALTAAGRVFGWGNSEYGAETVPAGLSNVVAVAAGLYHSLALTVDGRVAAWGDNGYGKATVPMGLGNVVAVAAGGYHSLALTADGRVVAWGSNGDGQTTVPAGLSNVVAVAAGGYHSLALTAEGRVVAWGDNIGWGGVYRGQATVPAGLGNVVAVAAGAEHNLALLLPSPNLVFTSRVIVPGSSVTLAVPGVVGRAALFQWYRDGTILLAGQPANSLVLPNLQASQLGTYTAVSTFPFARITNAVITLRFGADLEIANLDTPLVAFAGSAQTVAWTVANCGHQSAAVPWTDRVYLSDDDAVGNDYLVGEFPHLGVLETNQTVSRMQSIAIPSTLDPDRDYWWIVVTDTGNAIAEENEGNNARVSDQPTWLLRPPAPNLRVTSVLPSANPMSGRPVTTTWSVTNAGTWGTGAGLWQDAVYYSTTPDLNGSPVLMGRAQRPRPLGTNESYSSSLTATLPQGLSGTRYFIVQTDTDNRVNEGAFENDNTTASAPVAITLTPPPDLQVANITAPSNALSGTSLAVGWVVTNVGPGLTAESDWSDDVYLSPTNTPGTNAILLGSFPHAGALTNGQSYHSSASIPLSSSLSGSYYLLVHTDARSNVFEHVFEANNVTASLSPIIVTLAPPPDLAVAQVTAPATALASHALAVGYAVTNRGTDTFLSYLWEDHLYLTTNVAAVAAVRSGTLASVATLASEPQSTLLHFSGLDAGQSYSNTFTLTLPNGLSGSFYAIVETDSGGEVFELVRTNNLRASAAPIAIESRPADLVVTGLAAPSSAQAGNSLLVSWTVRNQGPGDTAVSSWTDRLVLSTDGVVGNADDVTLLNLDHNGLLAPGASYTVSNQVVTVPFAVAPGSYRLFLLTDSGSAVYEAANETNNISTQRTLAITRTTADLRVAAVTLSRVGGGGQGEGALQLFSEDSFLVFWLVENTGSAAPNSTTWSDAVYLSTNSVFDTNAVLLDVAQNPTSLAPGTAYTNSLAVTLPAEIQGAFFVHVLANAASDVIEGNRANNTLAATNTLQVTLRPVPDLEVVAVTPPAEAYSSQPAEFFWTVRNNGLATAAGEWFDAVYLSLDASFDPTNDVFIGYAARPTTLTNGQSYTQTATLTIPREVSGLCYVFVTCDGGNRVNERGGKANNLGRSAMPVSVWLRPPSDLVVGTINLPTNATAGYDMAITYTLRNQGTNAAFGPWVDSIYLSADDHWDINDVLFARVSQTGLLAAGGNRSQTITAPAPGALGGNYHVIVRTDILSNVPETDRSNNITATLDQTALEVSPLLLDVPATNRLAAGRSLYYRVSVPAGQWMVLEMDAQSATAATELYVRHGTIPTRSDFDLTDHNPLQPHHRLVIPDTQAGDYYILVYTAQVANPPENGCRVLARISEFLVLDSDYGRGGTAGNLTIAVNGVALDRTCTALLTNASGVGRPAIAHYYENGTRFYPTFDLRGLTPGRYSVRVQNGDGARFVIPDSLEVVATATAPFVFPVVSAPKAAAPHRSYQFTVQWGNGGLNDAPAPLLTIGNTGPFGLKPGDYSQQTRYTFLAANTNGGPSGILRPGYNEIMTCYVDGNWDERDYTAFADWPLKDVGALYDWESLRTELATWELPTAEFDRAFIQLIAQIGPTQGDFQAMLSRNCSLLPKTLGDPRDPDAALQIEWNRAIAATGSSISGRIFAPDLRVQFASMTITARNPASGDTDFAPVLLDGTFTFPRLASGVYEVSAMGALVNGGQPVAVGVNAGQAVSNLVLNATPGATVRGVVYNATTGQAISGATVVLLGSTNASAVAASDGNGSFAISGISSGTYSLVAESSGMARKRIQNLAIPTTGDLAVYIPLVAEARISGTVTTQSGIPVPSFGVILYPASTNSGTGVPIKGIAGAFTGTGINPSTYHVAISASGYLTHWNSNVTLTVDTTLQLAPAVLLPAATIAGRVVDRRGGGDTPAMMGAYQNNELVAGAFINDDGSYAITGLSPGTYTVKALLLPGSGVTAEIQVAASAGQTNAVPDATTYSGAIIEGHVAISGTGGPAGGIGVRLLQPDGMTAYAVTTTNGQFAFAGLAGGTYRVGLDPAGMFPDQTLQVTNIDRATNRADFTLDAVAEIEGTVKLANGDSILGASVALKAGTNYAATATTDAQGNYRFLLMTPGTFYLEASSSEGSFAQVGPIAVSPGDTLHKDIISGTGRLQIEPVTAYGTNALSGYLQLLADQSDAGVVSEFRTGNAVVLTNLAAGPYRIVLRSGYSLGVTTQVVVTAHQTVIIQPAIASQPVLSGVIADVNSSRPVGGATVLLLRSIDGVLMRAAVTSTNGEFTFPCLESADYVVVAYGVEYERSTSPVISLTNDSQANLVLTRATSAIQGRVNGAAGLPVVGARVVAFDNCNVPIGHAAVAADGRFTIPVQINSSVRLVVEAEGFGQATADASVTHNGDTVLPDVVLTPVGIAPRRGSALPSASLLASVGGSRREKWLLPGLVSFLDWLAEPHQSAMHTQNPESPADSCHRKLCATKWRDAQLAVDRQNKAFDEASEAGRELVGAKGEWRARAILLASGVTISTGILVESLGSILVADLAAKTALKAIGEPIALATLEFMGGEFIKIAGAGSKAASAASPEQLAANAADGISDCSEAAADVLVSIEEATAANRTLEDIKRGRIDPKKPWTFHRVIQATEAAKSVLAFLSVMDFVRNMVDASESYFGRMAALAEEIQEAKAQYDLAVIDYEKAAKGAFNQAFRYRSCLNKNCDPCAEPNSSPDCEPCKKVPPPVPPPSCAPTPRPPSYDPNDIVGPGGFGPEQWISPDQTFHYTVRFENDAVKALAPAQYVRITQLLSTNLDLRTFRLGVMGFGTNLVDVPSDRVFFQTKVNVTNTLGVELVVIAGLDLAKGEITWEFTSLDPATGDLPFDPYLGFLPPNTNGIIGQGFVTYTIKPKAGIATGGIINAQARIFFDYNEPMDTPNIFNTVDVNLPSSTMLPLPLTTNRNIFPVRWAGADAYGGAGISSYTIYVSDNSGPWQVWLANTPQMESLFVGQCGHSYQFHSVARDHVGNVEAATPVAQAAILLLPNQPPVLEPITNRWLAVGQALSITNRASDPDAGQQVTFSLAPGTPAGMAVNPTNGVLTWTPACVQGSSTNVITVIATDDGCGNLISVQSFAIIVTECLQTGLGYAVGAAGSGGCFPVSLESSFGLTNLTFAVRVPAGRFTNFTVAAIAPEVGSATVVSLGTTQAVVTLVPQPGQLLRGPKQFAEICFSLLPDQSSAFVWMEVQDILGLRENGTPIGNTSGQPGRTVVVSEHPLLECVQVANGKPGLLLYARPGWTCAIEERGSVGPEAVWREINRVMATNLVTTLPLAGTKSQAFYRAVRFLPLSPRLSVVSASGPVSRFKLTGKTNASYTVQTTTNLPAPGPWQPLLNLTLTNGWGVFDWTNAGEARRFFRAVEQ